MTAAVSQALPIVKEHKRCHPPLQFSISHIHNRSAENTAAAWRVHRCNLKLEGRTEKSAPTRGSGHFFVVTTNVTATECFTVPLVPVMVNG
jgi:hypothetical protein